MTYQEHKEYSHYARITDLFVTLFKSQAIRLENKLKESMSMGAIQRCRDFVKEVEHVHNNASALANLPYNGPESKDEKSIADLYVPSHFADELYLAKCVKYITTNVCFATNDPDARELMHESSNRVKAIESKMGNHNTKLLKNM